MHLKLDSTLQPVLCHFKIVSGLGAKPEATIHISHLVSITCKEFVINNQLFYVEHSVGAGFLIPSRAAGLVQRRSRLAATFR